MTVLFLTLYTSNEIATSGYVSPNVFSARRVDCEFMVSSQRVWCGGVSELCLKSVCFNMEVIIRNMHSIFLFAK